MRSHNHFSASRAALGANRAVGIFGGTFDPIHSGHLALARAGLQQLNLSCVIWVPTGSPPHRLAPQCTPNQRWRMLELATARKTYYLRNRREVRSERKQYTVPLLHDIRRRVGMKQPLVLLLGLDAFLDISNWHRWREILRLAHVAICYRPPPLAVTPLELQGMRALNFRIRRTADLKLSRSSLRSHKMMKSLFEGRSMRAEDRTKVSPVLIRLYRKHFECNNRALHTEAAGAIVLFSFDTEEYSQISATHVRQMCASVSGDEITHPIRNLVPSPVFDYIVQNKLYNFIMKKPTLQQEYPMNASI